MLSREKNKITYLHFIMSVLVILIHSINNETSFQKFFSIDTGIGQFAVPLFFMVSGFLFFRNTKSIYDVRNKIRKRVDTLLIPFMLWNIIYYIIHLIIKPGNTLNINELFESAFNYTYNPAFWFMYQLILLSIASLLLFHALKNVKYMVISYVVLILLIIFGIDLPFINEDAIIYYFTGGVLSIAYNRGKISFISKKNFAFALVIFLGMFFINRYLFALASVKSEYVNYFILSIILVRLSMSFVIFYFCDIIFKYERVPSFMQYSFFLYAIHYMIVKALIIFMKFFMYKFLPGSAFEVVEIIVFTISPVVCIVISYYLSKFMIKKFSKVYNVLTGNRK